MSSKPSISRQRLKSSSGKDQVVIRDPHLARGQVDGDCGGRVAPPTKLPQLLDRFQFELDRQEPSLEGVAPEDVAEARAR